MSNLLGNDRFIDSFIVSRPDNSGTWNKGRWESDATLSTISINASVQRLTPRETELLPELYRTRRAYKVYTQTELFPVDVESSKNADQISISGDNYDVISVEYWRQIYPHYKAIAVQREDVET